MVLGLNLGQIILLASLIVTIGLGINSVISAMFDRRVAMLREEINLLNARIEQQTRRGDLAEADNSRLRRDNQWLMERARGNYRSKEADYDSEGLA